LTNFLVLTYLKFKASPVIKPLTSLRFLFALMVFFSHIDQFFKPEDTLFQNLNRKVFSEGYIGVSFFFILSGFILALNYSRKLLNNQVSVNEFWLARIARVFPVHFVTLLLSVPLVWQYFHENPTININKFLGNTALLHAFIPDTSYFFMFNSPSWSLSDEAFFYFVFPFIIFLAGYNSRLLKVGWILLLLIPIAIYFYPDETQLHSLFYINPFYRIVDFILGIMLYQVYATKKLGVLLDSRFKATVLEVIAVALLVVVYAKHDAIPQGYRYSCYYWLPMALVIFVFAYQNGYLSSIISNKVFVFLGEISFSFYMIHQLVIRYIGTANNDFSWGLNPYVMAGIVFGFALLLAYVLHKHIELPLNSLIKVKFKQRFVNEKVPIV
jgi:peptidoglycan/LPS O-acetylase OafA/YrhL